ASLSVVVLVLLTACAACGDGSPTTTLDPDTTSAAAPEIVLSPEFVNGAVPGSRLVLLVSAADPRSGTVTVSAQAPGAEVVVAPASIAGSEVAEVIVVPAPTEVETDLRVTVTATAGDRMDSVDRTVTVVPWEDDREQQAREVLGLFLPWLEEERPELGLSEAAEFDGTMTAPLLLIVSHYGFYSDEWEVGVAWHVMVPPDDFAEMYLRPRDALAPTHAFRIGSWQTALATGSVEVVEVEPPPEVVR
ncbi:MAG: hypothetical protein AB1Z57_06085, partial [Acidimicrobiia bacterium]